MIRGLLLRAASLIAFVFTVSACNPSGDTVIGTDFYPGVTLSLQNSLVSVSRPQVLSGSSVLVTVSLKDTGGSPFVSTLPVVTLQTSGGGSAGILSTVINNGDGTYSSTFNAVNAGSATTIQALVDGTLVTSALPSVTVLSGNFSLAQSVLSVSSASILSGSTVNLILTVKDSSGNLSTSGGLTVGFSNSGGTSTGIFSLVTDNQNGTYSATFTGAVSGAATTLIATIQGQPITSTLPTLTVTDLAPSALTYSSNPATYTKGTAITNNTPTITGGTNTTYSVLPALPAGLSLNTTTGVISGTPASYTATASYVVSATNSSGNTTASVSIVVTDVPILSYAGAIGTAATVGTAMTVTPTTLSSQGATITGCAVKASTTPLPTWAAINSSTCVITGTPTSTLSSTSYTIDATNSAGTSTGATVSLSAVYPTPTLTSITPNSGTRNGGTTVTIAGTGFYSGVTVTLGGTACTSITVTSTTQITCTTPAHVIGAVDLVVTNPGTPTATLSSGFTFTSVAATQNWDFNTASQYTYDHTKIDFTGGVAELTASSQTDNSSNCTTGFGDGVTPSCGGTSAGTVWDATNSYVRLDHGGTATDLELDGSWTPAWTSVVGYWKLDETAGATSVADSSPVGTHSGTPSTGVTLGSAGKLNTAASFNGSANAGIVTNSALEVGSGDFTLAAWVKSTQAAASGVYPVIAGKDTANVSSPRIAYELVQSNSTSNVPYVAVGVAGTFYYAFAAKAVNDGAWHHLVGVRTGTTLNIYLDGVLSGTSTNVAISSNVSNSANFDIGGDKLSGSQYSGSIDDVAVWSAALNASAVATIYQHELAAHAGTFTSRVMDGLSPNTWTTLASTTTLPYGKELPDNSVAIPVSEVSASYSSTTASLMNGILGLWHLDEAAGTTGSGSILDRSGNGNNGTPTSLTLGAAGKLGTAGNFDGSSSYVTLPKSMKTGLTKFSVSVWIQTTESGTSSTAWYRPSIFGESSNGTSSGDFGITTNGGYLGMWSGLSSVADYSVITTSLINDNKWHHIVATNDGTTIRLYLDGTNTGSTLPSGLGLDSTIPFVIGAQLDNYAYGTSVGSGLSICAFHSGLIDEVGFWSRALSSTEALELYRRGANRIRYQVRSCPDSTCSTSPTWLGPDGSNQTYFSELNNNSIPNDGADITSSDSVNAASPSFAFSNFVTASPSPSPLAVPTNRYFQYRTIMESDDTGTGCNYGGAYTASWCSPELQSIIVGPTHYDTSAPTVSNITGVSYATLTTTFTPTTSCSSNALYNLSPDGTNWYYYTGGVWTAADGTTSKATLGGSIGATALAAFTSQYGAGSVFFRVFLQTNVAGTNSCSIDNLALGITQ